MKYQLYMNDLFGIKLIFIYNPSQILQLSASAWLLRSSLWTIFNKFRRRKSKNFSLIALISSKVYKPGSSSKYLEVRESS